MITKEILAKVCKNVRNADLYVPYLNEAFEKYNFNSPYRQEMFLAQCLHESMGFIYMREVWGPTKWQLAYEGHVGLGNTKPGDGKLFMGRGLIETTGRHNYQLFSDWIDDPIIMQNPQLLEGPKYAVLSAVYFWVKNNLNRFADADDIAGCTKIVNGPHMLGLEERTKYYVALKEEMAKD